MRIALAVAATVVAPAAAPNVDRLVLQPAQVGKAYVMLARTDGRGVNGTVTLNLCGTDYPSERLRSARLQVDYLKNRSALALSNEVVAYREGGAAQAMREVVAHALGCPARPMPSGIPGVPPLRYEITRLTAPGLLKGYLAVRVRTTGTVNGKHIDQISYAVYQRLGTVLSGVYSSGPNTAAQRDFCLAAARQSARNLRRGATSGGTPAA
jgi:phage tail protein X